MNSTPKPKVGPGKPLLAVRQLQDDQIATAFQMVLEYQAKGYTVQSVVSFFRCEENGCNEPAYIIGKEGDGERITRKWCVRCHRVANRSRCEYEMILKPMAKQ